MRLPPRTIARPMRRAPVVGNTARSGSEAPAHLEPHRDSLVMPNRTRKALTGSRGSHRCGCASSPMAARTSTLLNRRTSTARQKSGAARTRKRFWSCHDASPELTDRILCGEIRGNWSRWGQCVSSDPIQSAPSPRPRMLSRRVLKCQAHCRQVNDLGRLLVVRPACSGHRLRVRPNPKVVNDFVGGRAVVDHGHQSQPTAAPRADHGVDGIGPAAGRANGFRLATTLRRS